MAALRAVQAFQSKKYGNKSTKKYGDEITVLEKDDQLTKIRKKLESKEIELSGNNASMETKERVYNDVMRELEHENKLLTSLLKMSEENRSTFEDEIMENNNEIRSLQAKSENLHTLEDTKNSLLSKNIELNGILVAVEKELTISQKEEFSLIRKLNDLNINVRDVTNEATDRILDLTKELSSLQQDLVEKETIFGKTETTLRELLDKVQQLGNGNIEIKAELQSCILTGKNMKEANKNLQYCKDYLEEQVDQIVDNLKQSRSANEKLKLEIANLSADNQNHFKRYNLMKETINLNKPEIQILKHQVDTSLDTIETYKSGEVKSRNVMSEINKVRQFSATEQNLLCTEAIGIESEIVRLEEAIKAALANGKNMERRMQYLEDILKDFKNSFVGKQESSNMTKDSEVKYRLDINTHRKQAKSILDRSANDVINSVNELLTKDVHKS